MRKPDSATLGGRSGLQLDCTPGPLTGREGAVAGAPIRNLRKSLNIA